MWPAKPIRLIVPFAPGVCPHVVSRLVAEPLTQALGQPIVADNRVGAAGIIGAEAPARSPADGYTLFMSVNSIMGINTSVYATLPCDQVKDFMLVMQVPRLPCVLITGNSQPSQSLKDLLVRAKTRPASIDYESLGVDSGPHLLMEMMNNMPACA